MKSTQPDQGDARARLLAAGGRAFRSSGYGGAGIDGLAKDAGLTSGAFYAHFDSKAEAFELVVADGFKPLVAAIGAFQERHGRGWLGPFVDFYLVELGGSELCDACVLPMLSGDVARSRPSTRAAYAEHFGRVVAALAQGFRGERARDRAHALVSILAGAAMLCRALPDEQARQAVLDGARAAARVL